MHRVYALPPVGEQVYVDGHRGVFVVAWVDGETQTVDLVPSTGRAEREEYVPWQKLLGCWTPSIETVNAAPRLMRRILPEVVRDEGCTFLVCPVSVRTR
jgi:hypothetical protein